MIFLYILKGNGCCWALLWVQLFQEQIGRMEDNPISPNDFSWVIMAEIPVSFNHPCTLMDDRVAVNM